MAGRTLTVYLAADTTKFRSQMKKAGQGMDDLDGKSQGLSGKLSGLLGPAMIGAGAAAGTMALRLGVEGVQSAGDLSEAISKAGVIFGEAADDIQNFAEQANENLGSTEEAAINAASTFGQFGKAAGLAGTDLADFSLEFVQLATDLASFNNTSVDTAVTALGSALRGESEPMRQFGVLLDDATLKAKAMELGIYDGNGALDAQQKILAAHKVILEQTNDAQGDFERTSDSLNNRTKILEATVSDLKTAFGVGLLGALEDSTAATGADGLTGAMQDLKPALEDVGGYVGENIELYAELISNVTYLIDGIKTLSDNLGEDSELAKNFAFITTSVERFLGPGMGMLELLNDLISTIREWNNTPFIAKDSLLGQVFR